MIQPDITLTSPNLDARSFEHPIDMLVLHYTGMPSGAEAIARLCDRQAKVSAHYVVEEDGTLLQLVPDSERAWHAGVSQWRGRSGVNDCSIGVEIVNPGHEFGYRAFPDMQMRTVIRLAQALVARHGIPARNVVGHSDVAPSRKEDPGELFDWAALAAAGVGLWVDRQGAGRGEALGRPGDTGEAVRAWQTGLQRYGYGLESSGNFDEATEKAVIAFQRHFRPAVLDGIWDRECADLLARLLDMAGENA